MFVLALAGCIAASAAPTVRPNILFIVGDDMGYADVGFHGGREIPTPSLDALAASGVRFTSGYVSGPYCSPTRAALLTGRHQARFGHEFNPAGNHGLPLTETTLADRLKAAGYVTGLSRPAGGPWSSDKRSKTTAATERAGAFADRDHTVLIAGTPKRVAGESAKRNTPVES